jgi:hypothetical protein
MYAFSAIPKIHCSVILDREVGLEAAEGAVAQQ